MRLRWTILCPLLVALAFAHQPEVEAQRAVQGPARAKTSKKNASLVKRARAQRVKPSEVRAQGKAFSKELASGTKLSNPKMQSELKVAPLGSRLMAFKAAAKAKGLPVQSFTRRLRGMLKKGKTSRVAKSHKTVFEVLPSTLDLFRESMGGNVIWFAASPHPEHLHTLVADQNGGTKLTHNTYGAFVNEASIQRTQYMVPATLDQAQMARFTKYFNAGSADGFSGRRQVYGFKSSRGDWIYETECTNWATSAPIGNLHRWAQSVDKSIMLEAKAGNLGKEFAGGLHNALARAKSPKARQTLLKRALKAPGLSAWTRSSAKRLAKEFDTILEKFPKRPPELIARQTLSEIMGVNRSQDPAKWMFDLMLSKKVPMVGVLSPSKTPEFSKMKFQMEIMGTFNAKGEVIKGGRGEERLGIGMIPPDRR